MPWYKTGTISVALNSNAVIGTGTAFLANSRVGDAFRGPDGGWYEVINIASDTAMAISPNYQGASNAAGLYALAPMQGYVKDSADALRTLVNTYGAKLAALGTTGNFDVLPVAKGGTGSAEPTADFLLEGLTNKFFTGARAVGALLAGLVLTDGATITTADSVLSAMGKLQKQVSGAVKKSGDTLSGALNQAPIVSLESAATPAIGAAAANTITITGTTGITGFDAVASGAVRTLVFAGVVTLTHHATKLILPKGANITTAAGDVLEFTSLGSGNWRCTGKLLAAEGGVDVAALAARVATLETLNAARTWQDLTASRSLGTTYTNSTGHDIQVVVLCGPTSAANVVAQVAVSGITIAGVYATIAATFVSTASVIVPPSATYSVIVQNGTAALFAWKEFR